MGIFDSILGSVGGTDIGNLAAKVGIDPAMAEKAVAALGDTLAQALAPCYRALASIQFRGMQYRRDIGASSAPS